MPYAHFDDYYLRHCCLLPDAILLYTMIHIAGHYLHITMPAAARYYASELICCHAAAADA